MIGLSRLLRAIEGMPKGGMQTGNPKVTIKLCDAQRIKIEFEALQSQNTELMSLVEVLQHRVKDLQSANNLASACLKQVKADAVESLIPKCIHSADHGVKMMTEAMIRHNANKLRQGGE
jgi:hypothetical protein